MKANIVPAHAEQARPIQRVIDRLAKPIVLSKLEKIKTGLIRIIDHDESYEFGPSESTAFEATITVRNPAFYSAVMLGGSVGSGESYFLGDWDCDNLTHLVQILIANRSVLESLDTGWSIIQSPVNKAFHWLNRNTHHGSRRNIAAHYDIGNDLFKLMLDQNMMYSSAVYQDEHTTLEQASVYKLDLICHKLALKPEDHLIEIGTGWGGMAIHAAKHFGCRVTTTTISKAQYDYAKAWVAREGLEGRITLLFDDYRDLTGEYDKLVSIEMIEAVGLNNLGGYFQKCAGLLKSDGVMCIQAITIADQQYEQAKTSVDFIQKYIFPGGSLPSVTAMCEAIRDKTDLHIFDLEDMGPHYARTLKDWRERFFHQESKVRELGYSETFIRLWEFYLCYCEGGFNERVISNVHVLLTKPQSRLLPVNYGSTK